ncbi:hypothetical protein D3C85_254940 [compost metagenome]
MKQSNTYLMAVIIAALSLAPLAQAAVSPDEAGKLKSSLTPFGAERQGNAKGTIPSWDGGDSKVSAGYTSGDARPDPYANEKPLFSINAQNLGEHADELSDGVKALLQKYPQSYRLDVYPTHRTAAAPQWVYDNTLANATRAHTTEGGTGIEGAYGGIPFPIPRDGYEAMWNHKLAWGGEATSMNVGNYIGTSDGKLVLAAKVHNTMQFPYYDPKGTLESFKGNSQLLRVFMTDPPFKSGEQFLIVDSPNRQRKAWQYLAGQRRVRQSPNLAYDTPDDVNSGLNYYDEAFVFYGALDRFNWKLVGKKELLVPYNNSKFFQRSTSKDQQLMPHHLNPDAVRWELHRVWVVEADLAPGKRHPVAKRRYYLDEDTWYAVLADGWDAQGKLWRVQMALPFVVPEGPFINAATNSVYNLLSGSWVSIGNTDWQDPSYKYHFKVLKPESLSYFTPEALAGEGVR